MSAGRPTRSAETVAVLGAGGTMGFAMARNIARADGDEDISATYLTSTPEHAA
jgi:hypothetical protein